MHVKLIVYIAVLRERGCYESMPNSIGDFSRTKKVDQKRGDIITLCVRNSRSNEQQVSKCK